MLLREYQLRGLNAVIDRFDDGDQRTMIVMATGVGKTVLFCHLIKQYMQSGRVMVLAHRDELIRQAADKIGKITGTGPDIEKAEERSREHTMYGKPPIVVSSIQTQISGIPGSERMRRFSPSDFSLLVIDECVSGNTLITISDGSTIPISKAPTHLRVLSFNHDTGAVEPKWATLRINGIRQCIKVEFEDGSVIQCTPEHKIFSGDEYVEAKDLTAGSFVLSYKHVLRSSISSPFKDPAALWQDRVRKEEGIKTPEGILSGQPSAGVVVRRVISVEKAGTENVFDLTVEGNHNYFANGILVHNCHHLPAASWAKVADYYAQNPNLKIFGCTATPDRADKAAMGAVFNSVAFTYDLPDAINDGYLVPIHQRRVTIEGLDFSKCRTTAGDINNGDLEEAMLYETPLHGVVHATIEIACGLEQGTLKPLKDLPDRSERLISAMDAIGGRVMKVLIFATSVSHAQRMSDIINRWYGESSDYIHGTMTAESRKKVLSRFKSGEIRFLVGCMVPTEGFDEPSIEMVVMARPTKSRSLYSQMSGRGTRPLESIASILGTLPTPADRKACIASSKKDKLILLDFVGNSGRHKLVTSADILGGKYPDEVVERAAAMSAEEAVDMMQALEKSKEEIEQKKREAEEKRKRLEEEAKLRRQAEAAKLKQLVATSKYSQHEVDPFDRHAPRFDRNETIPEHAHLKPGVIATLRRNKVPEYVMARLDAQKAGQLAKEIIARHSQGLCSYAQAVLLQKNRYSKDETRTMTKDHASELIEAIAANGWRRPA